MCVCVCVCICAHVNAASDATEDCACIAGYTGPNGGTCTACEEGKYKDSPGPAACSTCPGNSTSPAGLCGLFVEDEYLHSLGVMHSYIHEFECLYV